MIYTKKEILEFQNLIDLKNEIKQKIEYVENIALGKVEIKKSNDDDITFLKKQINSKLNKLSPKNIDCIKNEIYSIIQQNPDLLHFTTDCIYNKISVISSYLDLYALILKTILIPCDNFINKINDDIYNFKFIIDNNYDSFCENQKLKNKINNLLFFLYFLNVPMTDYINYFINNLKLDIDNELKVFYAGLLKKLIIDKNIYIDKNIILNLSINNKLNNKLRFIFMDINDYLKKNEK